ncbi:MAG: o-succinylbenzoate synthase [Actinobacteria bacterium]|uniref:o-succinylbenzoate synthase n=2 Tax=freshwater metagenome TaxID=449393 RepID=A0A6J7HTH3_9ZZZZ|nr:o-succinylbenzoate synthase [Actinomycetota bacterium]
MSCARASRRLLPVRMSPGIATVELRIVALPLIEPFVASHGTVTTRTAVIVRVIGDDFEGWGECAALPEPTYTSEYVDGAFAVLRDELVPGLLRAASEAPIEAKDVRRLFAFYANHPMARAAIELALLDAECAAGGRSLARRFTSVDPGPAPTVPAGVAIGLMDTAGATASVAAARVAEGYRRIKMKIEPGRDIEFIRAVRSMIGADVELMVDANGAYTSEDHALLTQLDEFELSCVEQPLSADGPDDLERHAALAALINTPICLDESLTSIERTERAIELGACSVVCVKAPRYGSWLDAVAVLDHCRDHGVDAWVGGMLDTGIGRRANIALAAHPGATRVGDISATARFFTDDICAPVTLNAGRIDVPATTGLASSIDRVALERLTITSTTIST